MRKYLDWGVVIFLFGAAVWAMTTPFKRPLVAQEVEQQLPKRLKLVARFGPEYNGISVYEMTGTLGAVQCYIIVSRPNVAIACP